MQRVIGCACFMVLACGEGGADRPDAGEQGGDAAGDPAPDAAGQELWRPAPGTTWQWQLTGAIDTSIDAAMYDVDLFDTAPAILDELHAGGRVVVCYFSAGSRENWRDDADQFPTSALGKPLDGWAGERWLDVRDPAVRDLMVARLDLATDKGCDGVEPDNVDGYSNDSGFPLTAADQADYNRFLAAAAHARALSVGLKNDLDQVPQLVDDFDWALDEECVEYEECAALEPFIAAGKAVFHVEYGGPAIAEEVCAATEPLGFSTLIKRLDLGAWRIEC